jgi:hypothetical protein
MKIYHVTFAALLAASPLSAMAQQTTAPSVNSKEAPAVKEGTAGNSTSAGATGKSVVPGSGSSVAGDKAATQNQKTTSTSSAGAGK